MRAEIQDQCKLLEVRHGINLQILACLLGCNHGVWRGPTPWAGVQPLKGLLPQEAPHPA